MPEYYMRKGRTCPICTLSKNLFVDPDINGIKVTHPNIYKMIVDDDAEKYSYGSGHKVHWKCPLCEHINYTPIRNLTMKNPTGCQFCSDGVSYPEKILYGVMSCISDTYEKQKSFDWTSGRKYDVFDNGIFIEIHGEQHYVKAFEKCGGRLIEEEQQNDILKQKLAYDNYRKIVDYIVIKAYPTDFETIKNNILKSHLNEYYDLSKVDWDQIKRNATVSLVYAVAQGYNQGLLPKELMKTYQISQSAVCKYLHKGNDLGICNYNSKWYKGNMIKIIELKSHRIFESAAEAGKWANVSKSSILNCVHERPKCITAGVNPDTKERCRWCSYDDFLQDKEKVTRILNRPVRKNQYEKAV